MTERAGILLQSRFLLTDFSCVLQTFIVDTTNLILQLPNLILKFSHLAATLFPTLWISNKSLVLDKDDNF